MDVFELLEFLKEADDRSEPQCICPITSGEGNDPACLFMEDNREKLVKHRTDTFMSIVKEKFPDGIHINWEG